MRVLKQIGRVLAIIIAVLVIVLSVSGIAGSWYVNSVLANVTNQVFSVVNTGAGVAQTGVNRAEQLVTDGRAEVQNASTTVTSVGQHLEENSPVLTARIRGIVQSHCVLTFTPVGVVSIMLTLPGPIVSPCGVVTQTCAPSVLSCDSKPMRFNRLAPTTARPSQSSRPIASASSTVGM